MRYQLVDSVYFVVLKRVKPYSNVVRMNDVAFTALAIPSATTYDGYVKTAPRNPVRSLTYVHQARSLAHHTTDQPHSPIKGVSRKMEYFYRSEGGRGG